MAGSEVARCELRMASRTERRTGPSGDPPTVRASALVQLERRWGQPRIQKHSQARCTCAVPGAVLSTSKCPRLPPHTKPVGLGWACFIGQATETLRVPAAGPGRRSREPAELFDHRDGAPGHGGGASCCWNT